MKRGGLSRRLAACAGPAREVQGLRPENPPAVGLAVRAVPVGCPGVDGRAGSGRKDSFEVLHLSQDGSGKVDQRHGRSKS